MKFVVWPSEIDSRLPKKYGRLVKKAVAVNAPTIDEIRDAAEILGMKVVEFEPEKLNPRLSGIDEELRTKGMLRIESPYPPKGKSLRMICEKIRELRAKKRKAHGKRKKK
ncbi:signal recognition particle protein Srp19 [Thermococcus peptonophilus]|uniref:signal recognition particle protein Srp19 n=1 Tax=Thermococcus peptonophilus TaxID=53952 RepID=UPI0006D04EBC